MRAIVIEEFGGPDCLVYTELPEPEPLAGHVVIEIKAFGLNHAEMHMRRGEWAEAAKVSGIECVGLVKSCPGGEFPVGAKVAALMGGLGRTINGSYAEYTRAPASNNRERFALLENLGAERAELEVPDLSDRIAEAKRIDAVLDLVGNSTILDSLAMLRRGGRACLAGWLGGLDPIPDFNPLLQMASGVYLTFFGSFVFGTPGFPLSDVPLQTLAQEVAAGRLKAKPSRVFRFEEIREAHRVMEAGEAKGKMAVVHD
jgi:NADPH:quinone reductase-like Zn-dependent oxidoreductase